MTARGKARTLEAVCLVGMLALALARYPDASLLCAVFAVGWGIRADLAGRE